ncbi:MAG: hypothetical protein WD988_02045 [Candidatus Curtissbacteria bacterium]
MQEREIGTIVADTKSNLCRIGLVYADMKDSFVRGQISYDQLCHGSSMLFALRECSAEMLAKGVFNNVPKEDKDEGYSHYLATFILESNESGQQVHPEIIDEFFRAVCLVDYASQTELTPLISVINSLDL